MSRDFIKNLLFLLLILSENTYNISFLYLLKEGLIIFFHFKKAYFVISACP